MARYGRNRDKKSHATFFFVIAAITALGIGVVGNYYEFKFKRSSGHDVFKSESSKGGGTLSDNLPGEPSFVLAPVPASVKLDDEAVYWVKDLKAVPLPATLPDLLTSDASFRAALSYVSPGLSPWLNADRLIRRFATLINDASQGARIASHMSFLRLEQPFAIEQTDNATFISERSFHRYDKLAEAVRVINPKAIVLVYQTFRPLFLQVFGEFGYPADVTLESAIKKVAADLLAAPIIEGQIELVRPSLFYKYADRSLEELSHLQKQLVRMGPENTRIIQSKLREFMVEFAKLNFK